MILKHVSQRSPASLKSLQTYFAESVGHIKKLQVSTFFAPKKIHVDSKKLEVIADGSITSIFGKKGFEEKDVRKADRIEHWLAQGAQPTERVAHFIKAAGIKLPDTILRKMAIKEKAQTTKPSKKEQKAAK